MIRRLELIVMGLHLIDLNILGTDKSVNYIILEVLAITSCIRLIQGTTAGFRSIHKHLEVRELTDIDLACLPLTFV